MSTKLFLIIVILSIYYLAVTPGKYSLKNFVKKPGYKLSIKGDRDCIVNTNQALDLLKNKAKEYYDLVNKYIGVIDCKEQGSGMAAYEKPPRFIAGRATRDAGEIWYAGSIVHDSCHSRQYNDYLLKSLLKTVPDNVWTGKNAEKECLDIQYEALKKIGASQVTLDSVRNALNTNYWEVDYSQRWW